MKVLAIDQSFTSSGIILFDNNNIKHAERFVTDKNQSTDQRVWELVSYIRKLTKQFTPDLIALEGLAFARIGNATRDLAGLQFSLITVLKYIDNFEIKIITPNQVKKHATGSGNAKKQQMIDALPQQIKQLFSNLNFKKSTGLTDLADAYWIGQYVLDSK